MRSSIFFIATLTLLSGAVDAQVRKCTGADGKVTYSDFVCESNTVKEAGVKTDVNTLDGSSARKDAANYRGGLSAEADLARNPKQCNFPRFTYGDEAGKLRAAAAKQECLDNVRKKYTGEPTSEYAKNAYKEGFDRESTRRENALARDAVANRVYTCTPNRVGNTSTCR